MSSEYKTSHSLVNRAREDKCPEAWDELTAYYRNFIFYLLKQLNVKVDDIDDVSQEILITLMKDLHSYDRSKGKFRSWLRALIKNKVLMYFRSKRTNKERLFTQSENVIEIEQTEDAEIENIIEKEWQTYISTLAMERVSKSFRGNAVKAFEMALEGKTALETADELGITTDTVYILRKRVKRNLLIEVRKLITELEPS